VTAAGTALEAATATATAMWAAVHVTLLTSRVERHETTKQRVSQKPRHVGRCPDAAAPPGGGRCRR
jgi:hypothetical protein